MPLGETRLLANRVCEDRFPMPVLTAWGEGKTWDPWPFLCTTQQGRAGELALDRC